MNRLVLIFLFGLLTASAASAQFVLLNDVQTINDSTWLVTSSAISQKGQMWHEQMIDLRKDFSVKFRMNFGTSVTGADGMTFTLQTSCLSEGGHASAMGVAGISPSLILEFDTYFNSSRNDPNANHIALFKNGDNNHGSENQLPNIVGSNNVTVNNMEDGVWRTVLVTWDAENQTFAMNYSGFDLLSYTGDIVNDIFDGNPIVYWGFTGATGGSTNEHRVQILEYPENEIVIEDEIICLGDSVQVGFEAGGSFAWTGDAISDAEIGKPYLFPIENTMYTLQHMDSCGTVSNYVFEVGVADVVQTSPIAGDTELFCDTDSSGYSVTGLPGSTYTWSAPEGAEIIAGAGTDSIIVDFNGSFGEITVTETSASGCVGEPQSLSVSCLVTGVAEKAARWVSVFPNPASELIRLSGNFAPAQVMITDLSGRIVHRDALNDPTIDITSLSPGVYIGTVVHDGQLQRFKFVKR